MPVFYGVYTASGFLNSLIFNDEGASFILTPTFGYADNDIVDAYPSWGLFLILLSIVILIGGVVLLTNKKPEKPSVAQGTQLTAPSQRRRKAKKTTNGDDEEEANLREPGVGESELVWQIGDDSDEEDGHHEHDADHPKARRRESRGKGDGEEILDGERAGLMREDDVDHDHDEAASGSSSSTRVGGADADEFGEWKAATNDRTQ